MRTDEDVEFREDREGTNDKPTYNQIVRAAGTFGLSAIRGGLDLDQIIDILVANGVTVATDIRERAARHNLETLLTNGTIDQQHQPSTCVCLSSYNRLVRCISMFC